MKSSLKFIIAMLVLVAAVVLVACGDPEDTTTPSVTGPSVTTTVGGNAGGPDNPDNPGDVEIADEYTLMPGGKVTLELANVSVWLSSDSDVVTVSDKGVVTAKGPGLATIKAKTVSGDTVNYIFNVYKFKIQTEEGVTDCILSKVEGSAHEITIPAEIDGFPVVELGASALENFTRLTSVSFAEGTQIKTIGDHAFKGCTAIEEIVLPETVETIGGAAFAFCENLKGFTFPSKVTAISDGLFYACTGLDSYTIPAQITKIGKYAFAQCTGITEITIPDTVTSLGVRAFYYMSELKTAKIGTGVTKLGTGTFVGCDKLTSVSLPATLTAIDSYAFAECSALTTLAIPASVTSIGDRCFWNCTKLSNVALPAGLSSVSAGLFANTAITSVTIPADVTSIGAYAFDGCSALTTVTFGSKIETIGEGAFRACTKLAGASVPGALVTLGDYAFKGCSAMTSVSLPATITTVGVGAFADTAVANFAAGTALVSVGADAFAGTPWFNSKEDGLVYIGNLLYTYKGEMPANTALTVKDGTLYISEGAVNGHRNLVALTIPASVKKIGLGAFAANPKLATLTIPYIGDGTDEITYIGHIFGGTDVEENATVLPKALVTVNYTGKSVPTNAFYGCANIQTVNMPAVETVGASAFYGCTALANIDFSGVKSIGETAFYGCKGLTTVTLGNALTELGVGAFQACLGLTDVSVSGSLKTIPENAFTECMALVNVTIAEGVEEIGKNAFAKTDIATIDLPTTVFNVGETAFHNTEWYLAALAATENGPIYIDNQILYLVNGTPTDSTLKVQSGTKGIAFGAAAGQTTITALDLPTSLVYIGGNAFSGSGVASLTLTPNVKTVAEGAFSDCASLKEVDYVQAENANAIYSVTDNYVFGGAMVNYRLRADDYQVAFNGTGYTVNKYLGEETYLTLISEYNDGTNGWKEVNAIGESAFAGNTEIVSIDFTSSILTVGKNAFKGCTSFVGYLNRAITNARGSLSLTKVEYLGDSAFEGCTALTGVSINSTPTYVGKAAFKGCTSLASATLIATPTISESMFEGCTSLTTATYARATSVDKYAFKGCALLASAPAAGLVTVGESAYEGCAALKSVTLGACETIGKRAFKGCEALETLTLNSTASANAAKLDIGEEAFIDCVALKGNITFPVRLTSIGARAFKGCSAITAIETQDPKSGSYTIGEYAFEGCSGATRISFAKGIETISEGVVKGCEKIQSFYLRATVKKVESKAFEGCTALKQITFYGHGITSVEQFKANGGSIASDAFPAGNEIEFVFNS